MPLYAVIGLDHPPHAMPQRLAQRAEHRAYVLANDAPIALVGVMLDDGGNQCGSLYLFEADSEREVRDWLAAEPFANGDVYREVVVRRFELGCNRMAMQDWPLAPARPPAD